MVARDNIVTFIYEILGNELIEKALTIDGLANGVQVFGSEKVSKIALGVSLNEDFLKKAVSWGANMCIFHHGIDMKTYKSRLPIYLQKRLKIIFQSNLTIAGFHYALDVHPTLGNNAQILKKLGARRGGDLYEGWGYVGTFSKPQSVKSLKETCKELFDHDVFSVETEQKEVVAIGVCSGGAKPYAKHIVEMEQKGVQLFISGETSESVPHKMKEAGINYFVAGHYATESFGVKALGEEIKKHFGKETEITFIDIPNLV